MTKLGITMDIIRCQIGNIEICPLLSSQVEHKDIALLQNVKT